MSEGAPRADIAVANEFDTDNVLLVDTSRWTWLATELAWVMTDPTTDATYGDPILARATESFCLGATRGDVLKGELVELTSREAVQLRWQRRVELV